MSRGQTNIEEPGVYPLDDNNSVILISNLLSPSALEAYLERARLVPRKSGRSGFGMKPREEICYSPDGEPYVYSRIAHPTMKYPDYVLMTLQQAYEQVESKLGYKCEYRTLSSGVDILYSAAFPRGGSISAHSDDEDDWGLVLIFSVGQTRTLRVRNKETKQWFNIKMESNSVVAMHGATFQQKYTHQVDKLKASESVYQRFSLNARYKV